MFLKITYQIHSSCGWDEIFLDVSGMPIKEVYKNKKVVIIIEKMESNYKLFIYFCTQ